MIAFVNFLKIAAGCKFAYFIARCKLAFSIKKINGRVAPNGRSLVAAQKTRVVLPKEIKTKITTISPTSSILN
jgi:hypothetical protein